MRFAYLIEPPFNYRESDGKVVGCDVDLARHVFARLGIEHVEFVETEFAELLPGVAEGRWRMTTGLFATAARQKLASFSRPIWALPDGLLVKRGNPLKLSGYVSVAETEDCALAVVRDQIQHRTAIDLGVPDDRVAIFETYLDAARAVQSGRVAAYASVQRAHAGFIERNPESDAEAITVPAREKEPASGSFAFNKHDDDFRRAVDDVLNGYIGSAEHRAMMAGYGFADSELDALRLRM